MGKLINKGKTDDCQQQELIRIATEMYYIKQIVENEKDISYENMNELLNKVNHLIELKKFVLN